jgi:hypothetical protein
MVKVSVMTRWPRTITPKEPLSTSWLPDGFEASFWFPAPAANATVATVQIDTATIDTATIFRRTRLSKCTMDLLGISLILTHMY